ncbi:hypothetical protein LTR22_026300 [Elasticomyces elasticus]|nr:hypothetical protein LTR22_026300 [Elasticomyces elasticus]KAK4902981.1 hypothetical protein LTR49_026946 [Elasticomyces elasticus]
MMEKIIGDSGRQYLIEKTLQDKKVPFGRVYLASNGNAKFVLKEIPQDFNIRASIYHRIGSHSHVRTLSDTISARRMFVFDYLDDTFFGFAQRELPLALTKRILKCALQGLAALHEQDLVHNDLKANNIMIQPKENANGVDVEQVQLVDLEDTVHLPSGRAIMGAQVGNWMWRSPEAHAQGPVEKPSDLFSFGIVCIYAVTQQLIFAVDESELSEGEDKLAIVLERQISYFADEDGLNGFLRYIGAESPWYEIFQVIRSGFGEEEPRKPFALWDGRKLDEDFKALVGGLTKFDPVKRLTAPQALAHKWFRDV